MININFKFWVVIIFIVAQGCSQKKIVNMSTPTTGETNVAVDETFFPIIQAEKEVFESIYPQAKINLIALSEREAFQALEKGEVELIITARTLTPKQQEYFSQKKIFPKLNPIAIDGIAIILNPSNVDSCYTRETLKKIIIGEIKNWNVINPKSKLGTIKMIFDNPNSSTVRHMLDSVGDGEHFLDNMSALKTNKEVIEYVAKTKNAMGFIGVNWVSDRDDTTAMTFLKDIRVAYFSEDGTEFVQPYQAFMATRKYSLLRIIYTVCTEPRSGLASGFVSFLTSDRGQRIILKSGILPATAPVRLISVREEF